MSDTNDVLETDETTVEDDMTTESGETDDIATNEEADDEEAVEEAVPVKEWSYDSAKFVEHYNYLTRYMGMAPVAFSPTSRFIRSTLGMYDLKNSLHASRIPVWVANESPLDTAEQAIRLGGHPLILSWTYGDIRDFAYQYERGYSGIEQDFARRSFLPSAVDHVADMANVPRDPTPGSAIMADRVTVFKDAFGHLCHPYMVDFVVFPTSKPTYAEGGAMKPSCMKYMQNRLKVALAMANNGSYTHLLVTPFGLGAFRVFEGMDEALAASFVEIARKQSTRVTFCCAHPRGYATYQRYA